MANLCQLTDYLTMTTSSGRAEPIGPSVVCRGTGRFLVAVVACLGLIAGPCVDGAAASEELPAPTAEQAAQEGAAAAPVADDETKPAESSDAPAAAAGELPVPADAANPAGEELPPGDGGQPDVEAIAPGATQDVLALGMKYLTVDKLLDLVGALVSMSDDKPVPKPLLPKGTIVSAGVHLTPEVIDLLERRASEPEFHELLRDVAPDVADMAPTLAGLGPLLRKIKPEVQVVFAKPREAQSPAPGKLVVPTAAFVYQPADISEAKPRLLGLYLAVIAELNARAKQRGLPLFQLKSGPQGDHFVATARLPKDASPEVADAYPGGRNFSPSIAMLGNRFIVSSNADLLNDLIALANKEPAKVQLVKGPRVDVTPAAAALLALDNAQHLFGSHGPGGPAQAGVIPHLDVVRQVLESMPNQPRPLPRLGEPPVLRKPARQPRPRSRGTPL
ncbi:MAG: hypothetical protein K2Y37_19665 [Pirellulales bacterium]|nr:hypothetical protein [Pirellulales bacterium]